MVERQQEESQPRDSLNNLSHFSAHLHFAQKHVEHILIIIPEPSRTSIFRFSVLERPVHTESHDQISLYIQTSSYILTSLERGWNKSHCPGVAVAFAKTLPCSTSNFYKILTGTGEIYLNSSIVRLQVSQVQLERWLLKAGPRTSTSSTSLMLSRWQLRNGEVSNKEYDQLLVRQSPKSYRTC